MRPMTYLQLVVRPGDANANVRLDQRDAVRRPVWTVWAMRRLLLVPAVIAACALLLTGAAIAGRTVSIGQKANGTTVRLETGDTLRVSLPANLSTGYSWKIVSAARTVVRPADRATCRTRRCAWDLVDTQSSNSPPSDQGRHASSSPNVQSGSGQVAKTFLVIVRALREEGERRDREARARGRARTRRRRDRR